MKALSVKRPWAGLIFGCRYTVNVDGEDITRVIWKDVENRTWPLSRYFKENELPVRIFIHIPKRDDQEAMQWLIKNGLTAVETLFFYSEVRYPKGCIIGEIDITGCIRDSKSPWAAEGQYHFLLANPKLYDKPISCRGRLGFFEPDIEELKC